MLEIGFQTFTFRKFTPEQTLQIARDLGVEAVEFFPGHYPHDFDPVKIPGHAAQFGVRVPSFGVFGFNENPDEYRKHFDFAQKVGVETITADPHLDSKCLDVLEGLIQETGIRVAIHNHGPGTRYVTPEDVLRAVEGRDQRFGACIDSGHYLRAGVKPEEAAGKLAGRIHAVHIKDIKSHDDHTDAIFGQGLLDVEAFVQALVEARFQDQIMVEYEANEDDPKADVKACIDALLQRCPDQVRLGSLAPKPVPDQTGREDKK